MTQTAQRRDASSAWRNGMLAALAAVLIAGGAAPATATGEPLPRSKPAVTAPAKPAAARPAPRVATERRAPRQTAREREAVRVASMQRREQECILFFCWRNFPLLLGVGY